MAALALGALGVVFGDIGTSPLYALQAVFGAGGARVAITPTNVYGIISLIIWSITLVVSIKFVGFIMRADNEGEGGIMALVARVSSGKLTGRRKAFFILVGLIGVALFYGDSTITPAISVLSAVEGLHVVAPQLSVIVVPVTMAILAVLFAIQKYGTGLIGRLFGSVMLLWFGAVALGGLGQIWRHPDILYALSPLSGLDFLILHPTIAFVAMGAVVLAITGAEALYADMGHFGRPPIARAWFLVVFPALALCYMGEGALLLHEPATISSPLVLLFPETLRIAIVVLATCATIIASQSVISGTFSLTHQAVQLNFLPKMLTRHTSVREIGQIYLPFVNMALFLSVVLLVVLFGSSENLAHAYGIAVSGTLFADTLLYLAVMGGEVRVGRLMLIGIAFLFVPIDLLFVLSNTTKIMSGGLYPIVIGLVVFVLIDTWRKGQRVVDNERKKLEGSLRDFVTTLRESRPPATRVDGAAIYIGHHPDFTPTALRSTYEDLHELPRFVTIVYLQIAGTAHVPEDRRVSFDNLGYEDGISRVSLKFGYHDRISLPETLSSIHRLSPEMDFDPRHAAYFVSKNRIVVSRRHTLPRWQKKLYVFMMRNAMSESDYYRLPLRQTTEMQTLLTL